MQNLDFDCLQYTISGQEHEFYFVEFSTLQALASLPADTLLENIIIYGNCTEVEELYLENAKQATIIKEFVDLITPALRDGVCIPISDLSMSVDKEILLSAHDDGEVTIQSSNFDKLREFASLILNKEGFNESVLKYAIAYPGIYHQVKQPNTIIRSYNSFDEYLTGTS